MDNLDVGSPATVLNDMSFVVEEAVYLSQNVALM